MNRWLIFPIIIVALGIVGGAGYYGYRTSQVEETPVVEPPTVVVERGDVVHSVTAPGALIDAGATTVQSRVNGQVEQVLVQPGDRVQSGQTLVVLGDRAHFEVAVTEARISVIEAQMAVEAQKTGLPLAEARLALSEAQKAYDKAKTQRESKQYARSSQETIDIARANMIVAADGVDRAEELYNKFTDRPEDDPMRAEAFSQLAAARQKYYTAQANLNWLLSKPDEKEIAEADANLALAQAQLDEAQRKYDAILKDGGPELALAEARLQNAEVRLAEAEAALESLEVKAPFDGVVTAVSVKPGQTVAAGNGLVELSNPRALEAEVTVVEEDYPLVEVGQVATLFFDAIPEANVTGKVARVVPRRAADNRALYSLYITLDQIPEKLAAGMTVDASIVIDQKEGVLRLPRALVRARSDNSAEVEVWANGRSETREIWVGLRGDSAVEIISGLEEGEYVVAR